MKPGDPIRFTDFEGSGVLLEIKGEFAFIRDEFGIEMKLPRKQIVSVFSPDAALPQFRNKSDTTNNTSLIKNLNTENEDPWIPKREIPKVKDVKLNTKESGLIHKLQSDVSSDNKPKQKIIQNERCIDLHLHEIIENTSGMSVGDKLSFQLDYFRKELRKAENDRIRSFIIIHGVGKGILKSEVRRLLHDWGYDRVSDAPWKKFGSGATIVELIRRGL
jgi:hypothetical protein